MTATLTAPNPAGLEANIVRLADAIGTMRPSANQRRDGHIATLNCGPELGDMSIADLAHLHRNPDHWLLELVDTECSQGCGAKFQAARWVASRTACDECIEKAADLAAKGRVKKHWEKICPKGFRDTDKKHAGFPKLQLDQLNGWTGTESLFLYGPTGMGKTRLAMLMIRRAMMKNHWVGVLWPEKLRSLTQGFDNSTFDHFAAYDVLLMDDPLLTACRESKLVDAVKMLVDVRMREKRATIFTSQIGTEEEVTDGKEFGEAKGADKERIKAVLRRIKETCRVISFAKATPADGEAAF